MAPVGNDTLRARLGVVHRELRRGREELEKGLYVTALDRFREVVSWHIDTRPPEDCLLAGTSIALAENVGDAEEALSVVTYAVFYGDIARALADIDRELP